MNEAKPRGRSHLTKVLFAAVITLLTLPLMPKFANAFTIGGEETNTCSDWGSNTKNENDARYQWMARFVHGIEMTMYPDRKTSARGGRAKYLGSQEIDTKIEKRTFVGAIDKACKDNPGYPLADLIAESIMQDLNINPSQATLPQETYVLEISVCNGRVESFVGNGELVTKGVQMINIQCPSLTFTAERNSWIGRQILKECPLHSRCHVEGYAPGDLGIQILIAARAVK